MLVCVGGVLFVGWGRRMSASCELLFRGLNIAGTCGHIHVSVCTLPYVCALSRVRSRATNRPPSGPGCCPLNPVNKSLTTIIITINNK